jgi:hypothetical protein
MTIAYFTVPFVESVYQVRSSDKVQVASQRWEQEALGPSPNGRGCDLNGWPPVPIKVMFLISSALARKCVTELTESRIRTDHP